MMAAENCLTPSASVLRWIAAFEDDVRAGKCSLMDVVETALSDLESGWELCPRCLARPVRELPGKTRAHGLCRTCILRHLAEVQVERLAEIDALAVYNQSKKALQRRRDELGVMPAVPKRARDYGGRWIQPTSHPLMAKCDTCDTPFVSHGGATTCSACLERREARCDKRRSV